ncbi:MAG: Signal peptidase-like protein, partial [Cyclobacteriaceae bacterium]
EILRLNQEGKKPATLEKDQEEEKATVQILNSDLQRMDQKYSNKGKKKKKKRKGPGDRPGEKRNPNSNKPRNQG